MTKKKANKISISPLCKEAVTPLVPLWHHAAGVVNATGGDC